MDKMNSKLMEEQNIILIEEIAMLAQLFPQMKLLKKSKLLSVLSKNKQ